MRIDISLQFNKVTKNKFLSIIKKLNKRTNNICSEFANQNLWYFFFKTPKATEDLMIFGYIENNDHFILRYLSEKE